MISKQMDRSEVAEAVGVEKKNIGPVIKEMKAAGRLIEVRPYIRPHIDKKRGIRFVFVATTGDMFSQEAAA